MFDKDGRSKATANDTNNTRQRQKVLEFKALTIQRNKRVKPSHKLIDDCYSALLNFS